jgi:hypothetical protein
MLRRSSSSVRFRSLIRGLTAVAALTCAATVTAPAHAAPSFTLERTTLGGGIRWASEDLEFGLGVRGGYTLRQGIYIGGLFDYWFGDDDDNEVAGVVQSETDINAWNLMGVVGYDAGITPSITIRPYGGFGFVHVDVETCGIAFGVVGGCSDNDETDPGMVLGGEALFEIGSNLHVGPEIRIMIFEEAAFIIGGNFGGTF